MISLSKLRAFRPSSTVDRARVMFHGAKSRDAHKSVMMMQNTHPFYVSTPIYYVNGQPHLGHAYTSVAADVIARFQRKCGRDVYFLTGTDEHGQKVQSSAAAAGKSPKVFADEVSATFRMLSDQLLCTYSRFIRTTDADHMEAAKALWRKMEINGDIYLGAYEGWYSVRDEAFYGEEELVDGKAPTGAPVEWVKEESYFFRLSKYTKPLLELYKNNPDFVGPDGRIREVISFVSQEGGLRDLSISRTTFDWGIPVPNNPKHVMYVWMDALTNYISALDYPNSQGASASTWRYWPADLHIVGKDILRFHTVYWPAFLMAAGLTPPKKIFAHGWWTVDGEKMSKSVGNVIDPFVLLQRYNVDYVRYFLTAEVSFGGDGDFSVESFTSRINSNLANDLGNLAQRVFTLAAKHCNGCVPEPGPLTDSDNQLLQAALNALDESIDFVNRQSLHRYCISVIEVATMGNKYIDTEAPWKLAKTDKERMKTVLYVLIEVIRRLAIILEPVVPQACCQLLDQTGAEESMRTFSSISSKIVPGSRMATPNPVFPKIDTSDEAMANAKAALKFPGQKSSSSSAIRTARDLNEILKLIEMKGDTVRQLKASKATKEDIKKEVDELLNLKSEYKTISGAEYSSKK